MVCVACASWRALGWHVKSDERRRIFDFVFFPFFFVPSHSSDTMHTTIQRLRAHPLFSQSFFSYFFGFLAVVALLFSIPDICLQTTFNSSLWIFVSFIYCLGNEIRMWRGRRPMFVKRNVASSSLFFEFCSQFSVILFDWIDTAGASTIDRPIRILPFARHLFISLNFDKRVEVDRIDVHFFLSSRIQSTPFIFLIETMRSSNVPCSEQIRSRSRYEFFGAFWWYYGEVRQ